MRTLRASSCNRIFDNYSQAVRGVQAYTDPGTNTRVDLPNGYTDAWTNGWDYVMSIDGALTLPHLKDILISKGRRGFGPGLLVTLAPV